jgi:alpha-glucosidase (family GH31 glycosyl hydrolase)
MRHFRKSQPGSYRLGGSTAWPGVTALCVLALLTGCARGEPDLQSDRLELHMQTAEGLGWHVIDRKTGKTLLRQAETELAGAKVTGVAGLDRAEDKLTARLDLAGGGKARASFRFDRPDVLTVSLAVQADRDVRIAESFVDPGLRYYGVWEAPYGQTVLDNAGLARSFDGHDVTEDHVYAANARAPFYFTNGGFGVYVQTLAIGEFSLARDKRTGFAFAGDELTYHVIAGNPAEILKTYNQLAGPSFRPPDWAHGVIWWRDDHKRIPHYTQAENAQQLVLADARLLRRLRLPATACWIDRPFTTGDWGWGGKAFDPAFPDPDQMVRDLDAMGMKMLVWIANRAAADLRDGARDEWMHAGGTCGLDVRNPQAYAYFNNYLDGLLQKATLADGTTGIAGYKIDRGGEGGLPRSAQNELVVRFNKLAYEGLARRRGDDQFIFARSVNDTSRRYVGHWNGDPRATWLGLETTVVNGIRCGLINMPIWCSDTGGYKHTPSKELFLRWMGFTAYCPVMQIKFDLGRDGWFYQGDKKIIAATRKLTKEHHELIPYSRSLVDQSIRTGLPPIRAMLLAFPDDEQVADMGDQYMFGPSLLVAPVLEAGAGKREVYLPAGEWIDANDPARRHTGPKRIEVRAPLDTVPLLARAGAVVPRGDIVRGNDNWTDNWAPRLDVHVYAPSPSKAESRFVYWTGKQTRPIHVRRDGKGLSITFEKLGEPGQLVVFVDKATAEQLAKGILAVRMDGRALDASRYTLSETRLTVDHDGSAHLEIRPAAE